MINFWFYDTFCTLLSVPSSSAMNWVYIRGNSRVRMNEKPHMLWFEKFVTSKPPSSLCWTRIFRNVNENQRRLLRILTLVQHVVVRRWWTHWRCADGKFIIYDSSEENWKLSRLHFPPMSRIFPASAMFLLLWVGVREIRRFAHCCQAACENHRDRRCGADSTFHKLTVAHRVRV